MRATRFVGLFLVLSVFAADAVAQRRGGRRLRSMRDDPKVLASFAEVVQQANRSTVELRQGGDQIGFATAVAPGILVAKASELDLEGVELMGGIEPVTYKLKDESYTIELIGSDRRIDLAVLRSVRDPESKSLPTEWLQPVVWSEKAPARGAWLATVDGDGEPVAVGILSCREYVHSPRRGYLGVRFVLQSAPPKLEEIVPGTAASAAGLKADDVIVSVNATKTETVEDLRGAIGGNAPGAVIKIDLLRDGELVSVEAKLRERDEAADRRGQRSSQERIWGELSGVRSGFATGVLQHDTILYPNECGGPIVSLDGRVVGINISRAGRVESLALPRDTVLEVVERVLREEESKTKVPASDGASRNSK